MTPQDIRRTLEQKKGERTQIQRSLKSTKEQLRDNRRDLIRHEEAREIIRQVGLKTQQSLQYHIGDITSLALDAVFPKPYELVVEFVERRNKVECDLLFQRDGERIDPISASGGGAVDVAAFALRVASWSMNSARTRNTIILDEPMRFLSRDLQDRASQMLSEISKRLGLQFIIITHEPTLAESADKVFTATIKQGKTKIE